MKERMKTSYGLEFDIIHEIDPAWSEYDRMVAGCHLANAGVIIVDCEYGQPIDNEYDLDEIYRIVKVSKNTRITTTDIFQ